MLYLSDNWLLKVFRQIVSMVPVLFLLFSFSQANGQSQETSSGDEAYRSARFEIPDVVLVDQDGAEIHFYRDLIQEKVVAINFIFTHCPTICPPMGVNFGELQKRMGKHPKLDLNLISISIDPLTDTPDRLKQWGKQFGAGPGWTLLTGSKKDIDRLLKALKSYSPDIANHSPTILIGNDAEHRWTRANGLAPPAKLQEIIENIAGRKTGEGER